MSARRSLSRIRRVQLGAALLVCLSPGAHGRAPRCQGNPSVIGACFTVHARLSAYNGNPSLRLWVIGTKRLLGVSDDAAGKSNLPAALDKLASFDTDLFGDFQVCPFTDDAPGVMRTVCIESVERLVVQKAD